MPICVKRPSMMFSQCAGTRQPAFGDFVGAHGAGRDIFADDAMRAVARLLHPLRGRTAIMPTVIELARAAPCRSNG